MSDSVPCTLTFEQARAELEQLVHDLEDGRIGLQEALDRYEKGIGLLKHCYQLLQQAEQRILQLTGVDENGQPVLQPFTPGAEAGKNSRSADAEGRQGLPAQQSQPRNKPQAGRQPVPPAEAGPSWFGS